MDDWPTTVRHHVATQTKILEPIGKDVEFGGIGCDCGIARLGDQLLAFAAAVDFEILRRQEDIALAYSVDSHGRQPPFDAVTMFTIPIIEATNNLPVTLAKFLINDLRLLQRRDVELGRPPQTSSSFVISSHCRRGSVGAGSH